MLLEETDAGPRREAVKVWLGGGGATELLNVGKWIAEALLSGAGIDIGASL